MYNIFASRNLAPIHHFEEALQQIGQVSLFICLLRQSKTQSDMEGGNLESAIARRDLHWMGRETTATTTTTTTRG